MSATRIEEIDLIKFHALAINLAKQGKSLEEAHAILANAMRNTRSCLKESHDKADVDARARGPETRARAFTRD